MSLLNGKIRSINDHTSHKTPVISFWSTSIDRIQGDSEIEDNYLMEPSVYKYRGL